MGNQLAAPQKQGLDPLSELPKIVLKDTLGGGRFLKTLQCVHDEGGLVVVKVYYKRGETPPLETYGQQLLTIRNKLKGIECPHVWPFQYIQETGSAAYLMRQYLFANLYDRLSTRPFLSNIEKRWITYQLIQAVAQSHERGICHGDIKCENVLLTSWHWLFLVDFAAYKPALLPADNPADFSFYFDTGGRRRCYIAPERFYEGSAAAANTANAALHPSMDIFSLGCVIAEIFLDGKALFDLSQLLAYRRNEYDPTATLAAVAPDMRRLILDMIQVDPDKRWSAENYLKHWSPPLFPQHFDTLLHPFFNDMLRKDTDARMAAVWKEFGGLVHPDGHPPSSSCKGMHVDVDATGGVVSGRDGREQQGVGQTLRRQESGAGVKMQNLDDKDATAPSGVPEDLLPSVESLLDHAQQLAGHVEHLGLDIGDDGGFLLDDGAEGGITEEGPKAAGFRDAESAQVDEVVVEEVYEYQLREEGQWVMDPSGSLPMGTPRVHRKEDVKLPPGGWQWADDWHVDFRGHPCDSSGWQYRSTGRDGVDASCWTSECTQTCVWRRRGWKRSRKRSISTKAGVTKGSSQPLHADLDELVKSESVVLIAVLLCTLLRGSKLQQSKRYAIRLLCEIAMLCDDEVKLQCVVPYLLALVSEPCASVRALALRCLVKLVSSAKAVAPSDSKVFQDYILPSLSLLPNDEEESVRVEYALGIAQLAAVAHQHLKRLYTQSQLAARGNPNNEQPFRYEQEMAAVRSTVEKVVLELITGQRSSAEVKRGMLSHVQPLALFFGRRELNDLLLPLLITCLNANEWQLRSTFFRSIASIGTFTGKEALDVFLLPCLEQALVDSEPSVVADAVGCLAQVTQHLRKRSLMAAASRVVPLLHHSHAAVRVSAVGFIATAARMLPLADVYTQLLQLLDGLLNKEPILLTDEVILADALKPPSVLYHEDSVVAAAATVSAGADPPLFSHLFMTQSNTPNAAHTPRSNSSRGTFSERKPGRHRRVGSGLQTSHSSTGLAAQDEQDSDLLLRPNAPTYTVELDASQITRGSHHSAAVRSLPSKIMALKERQQALHDKLSKDPSSLDVAELQQLEKLTQTLARLRQPPGTDVRDVATMNTWQLVRLATRTSPQQNELATSAAHLAQSMLQPFPGEMPPIVANPGVSDDISAAISTGIIPSSTTAFIDTTVAPWRPNGVLVAHLYEHRKGVNKLAVAKNGAFFVSGSNDETVKVWDLRRLEKDVSFHSQLTYAGQTGRILSVAAVEDDTSVASASSSGSIHIWRVEYTRRPSGAPDKYTGVVSQIQLQPGEGAVLEMLTWGPQLLYVTQRGGVHGWDMRMGKDGWVLPAPPWMGLVESTVADPVGNHWVLTGTSRGFMSLWDVRFILSSHRWQHPCRCPIDAMAPAVAHPSCLRVKHQDQSVPLVYVAAGEAEVGLWDVANATCQQVLRVVNAGELDGTRVELPAALQQPQETQTSPTSMSASLEEVHAQRPRGAGVRALLPTPSGPLITAGSDRCIRYWDAATADRSYMVCGPIWPDTFDEPQLGLMQVPCNKYSYSARAVGDVPVIEEYCLAESPTVSKDVGSDLRTKMRINDLCHNDAITDLTVATTSGGNKLLLSCSRDGCVKAWR